MCTFAGPADAGDGHRPLDDDDDANRNVFLWPFVLGRLVRLLSKVMGIDNYLLFFCHRLGVVALLCCVGLDGPGGRSCAT